MMDTRIHARGGDGSTVGRLPHVPDTTTAEALQSVVGHLPRMLNELQALIDPANEEAHLYLSERWRAMISTVDYLSGRLTTLTTRPSGPPMPDLPEPS